MTQNPLPGYQPIQPPDRDLAGVRRITEDAKILSGLLIAAAVTSVAGGIAHLLRARAIDRFLNDGPASALDGPDLAVRVIWIADLLVYIGTAVYFMIWSWRVFKNAKVIAPEAAPAPGWAIGAWFIPVAGLALPAYFISRVDRISDPRGRGARPFILGWIVVYAAANLLDRVIWRTSDGSLASLLESDRRDTWVPLLYVAAAVLGVLMVRSVTARQERALLERQSSLREATASREAAARAPRPPGFSAPIDPTVGVAPRTVESPQPPGDPGRRSPGLG